MITYGIILLVIGLIVWAVARSTAVPPFVAVLGNVAGVIGVVLLIIGVILLLVGPARSGLDVHAAMSVIGAAA